MCLYVALASIYAGCSSGVKTGWDTKPRELGAPNSCIFWKQRPQSSVRRAEGPGHRYHARGLPERHDRKRPNFFQRSVLPSFAAPGKGGEMLRNLTLPPELLQRMVDWGREHRDKADARHRHQTSPCWKPGLNPFCGGRCPLCHL